MILPITPKIVAQRHDDMAHMHPWKLDAAVRAGSTVFDARALFDDRRKSGGAVA